MRLLAYVYLINDSARTVPLPISETILKIVVVIANVRIERGFFLIKAKGSELCAQPPDSPCQFSRRAWQNPCSENNSNKHRKRAGNPIIKANWTRLANSRLIA